MTSKTMLLTFLAFQILGYATLAGAQTQAPTQKQSGTLLFSPNQAIEDQWKVKGWRPATPADIQAAEDAAKVNLKLKDKDTHTEAQSGVPIRRPADGVTIYQNARDILSSAGSCTTFDDVKDGSNRGICATAFLAGQRMQIMDLNKSELFVDASAISSHPAVRIGWRLTGGRGSLGAPSVK